MKCLKTVYWDFDRQVNKTFRIIAGENTKGVLFKSDILNEADKVENIIKVDDTLYINEHIEKTEDGIAVYFPSLKEGIYTSEVIFYKEDRILNSGLYKIDVRTSYFNNYLNELYELGLKEATIEMIALKDTLIETEEKRVSDEKDRLNSEVLRKENEALRIERESDRVACEALRKKEEEKRKLNEAERVSLEEIRVTQEQKRVSSEENRLSGESRRVSNESKRETKEQERKKSEDRRNQSEIERETNEGKRKHQEDSRVLEENARKKAEELRVAEEKRRAQAEKDRGTKESTRNSEEVKRKERELSRINSETAREKEEHVRRNSESKRIENENSRVNSEKKRVEEEKSRVREENIRVSNEQKRISNEIKREKTYEKAVDCVETLMVESDKAECKRYVDNKISILSKETDENKASLKKAEEKCDKRLKEIEKADFIIPYIDQSYNEGTISLKEFAKVISKKTWYDSNLLAGLNTELDKNTENLEKIKADVNKIKETGYTFDAEDISLSELQGNLKEWTLEKDKEVDSLLKEIPKINGEISSAKEDFKKLSFDVGTKIEKKASKEYVDKRIEEAKEENPSIPVGAFVEKEEYDARNKELDTLLEYGRESLDENRKKIESLQSAVLELQTMLVAENKRYEALIERTKSILGGV